METSLIGRVADLAARAILREGTVRALEDLSAGFRRVDLDVASVTWAPGQKVQFRVRGIDFRTYTPFAWTASGVSFLAVRHGTGPAATWVESLAPGQTVQMWGPRSAVDPAKVAGPPIFVGDETSFALTAAWTAIAGSAPVAAQLYEVGSVDESRAVLEKLALGDRATLIARAPGDTHRAELARRAVALAQENPGAPIVLTGNVRSIRAIRDALKEAQVANAVRAKAHWDPDRKGLD